MKAIIIYNIIAAAIAAAVIIPLAAATGTSYKAQQESVYQAACQGGNALRDVISGGISINTMDTSGETSLMKAAELHNSDVVLLLINNGANVNMQNNNGQTALMLAPQDGSTEIVCMLLEANADPNIRDKTGETALQKAENAGHHDTAGLIGRSGGR